MLFSLSRSLRRWTSTRRFMFAVALFCLSNVGLMLIHNKLQGLSSTDTLALDLRRDGYTVQDVHTLLDSYGPKGRQLYTIFEALDLGVFMWSYAAVLSMMLSLGTSVARHEVLKLANLVPWAAAMADSLENIIILAMLLRYPELTSKLAPYAVAASKLKWQLLYAAASAVGGVGFYCLGVAARRAAEEKKKPKARLEATHSGQKRQQSKKQR